LITEKVENWSFTDSRVRIRIPVGISYEADVPQALRLIESAAKQSPRILDHPEPKCLVRGFGDSTINVELRIWIDDPANGMGNI
jgi:small-conductance mechanosensitive channel